MDCRTKDWSGMERTMALRKDGGLTEGKHDAQTHEIYTISLSLIIAGFFQTLPVVLQDILC